MLYATCNQRHRLAIACTIASSILPVRYLPLDRGAAGVQDTFFNWAPLQAGETGNLLFPRICFCHR